MYSLKSLKTMKNSSKTLKDLNILIVYITMKQNITIGKVQILQRFIDNIPQRVRLFHIFLFCEQKLPCFSSIPYCSWKYQYVP